MSPTVNIVGQLVLVAILAGAFGVFFWRLNQLYRLAIAGAPTTVPADQGTRLVRFAKMVLAQTKMFEKPGIGLAHFLIFWGFLILTLALVQVILDGLIHGLRLPIVSSRAWSGLARIHSTIACIDVPPAGRIPRSRSRRPMATYSRPF